MINDDQNKFDLDSALCEVLRFALCEDKLTMTQYYALYNLLHKQYAHCQFGGNLGLIHFWVSI